MNEELDQVRDAMPDVGAPSPRLVETERNRLMAHIREHEELTTTPPPQRRRRRWAAPVAVVAVLATAAAGWAVRSREGQLDRPPFSGDTWQLVVGEGDNRNGTFKVCHSFQRTDEAPSDGNGLGAAGCDTVTKGIDDGPLIVDVVPAVKTPTGVVVFVELSVRPFALVRVVSDSGVRREVEPFRMPQSGKHFAAVEIPGAPKSVSVEAVGPNGAVIESRTVTDLVVR